MIKIHKPRIMFTMLALLTAGLAQARPAKLICRDSVNLYVQPYNVVVDAGNLTVQINKQTGPLTGRRQYPIEQVETDPNGYTVVARGRTLNATMKVVVTVDEKWIAYTDAVSDRPYAIDYCH